jgi:uncharacterized membrane protein
VFVTTPTTEPTTEPTTDRTVLATMLLAGASGARSMAGLAAVARHISQHTAGRALPPPARYLATPRSAAVLAALAAMELAGDKRADISNRTDMVPLVSRAAAGAVIGATLSAMAGRRRGKGAVLGAVSAVVGAEVSFRLRRWLSGRLPSTAAALVEDGVVISVARAGMGLLDDRALGQRRPLSDLSTRPTSRPTSSVL